MLAMSSQPLCLCYSRVCVCHGKRLIAVVGVLCEESGNVEESLM